VLFLAIIAVPARARADDAAIISAVEKIQKEDIANANFGDAKKKLKAMLDKCGKKPACGTNAIAQIHLALGMVNAQIGRDDEAKQEYTDALNADASVSLPASGTTDSMKKVFSDAQKAWIAAHPQPDDSSKAGWQNKVAFDFATAATLADQQGNYADCIQKDRAALQLEEQPRARLHLAGCEQKASKIIDALRDTQKAFEVASQRKDAQLTKAAQVKLADLLPKISHVTFKPPPGAGGLKVTFDEKPVPADKLGQNFSIDPGQHHTHAEGQVTGILMSFDQTVDIKEGETKEIEIRLSPTALTPGELECMLKAKSEEEIRACLPKNEKPLVVRAGLDFGAYTDSLSVNVITPAIHGSIVSPTGGWNIGASYTLDVLTAASPDVVATASRRFYDNRHAVTATGGYKPGRFGGQISAFGSSEKDYFSRGANVSVNGDFYDKQLTPQLGVGYSIDTAGRSTTPFSVFSEKYTTLTLSGGATIVASPTSVLVVGTTIMLERGDQSKPYRWIPMFDQGVTVPVGASISSVNANRLPIRPLEHLPTERDRYSLNGRYLLRVKARSTLRLEERLYYDSWGVKASTSDARWMYDVSKTLVVWPHAHLNAQTGASFFQRAYTATLNPDGSIGLPADRTTDRELSALLTVAGGPGSRLALTPPENKVQIGLSLQADVMYSRYFNALFIKQRMAYYGTIGIDGEFE
jgi:tetratricopeptide (TPR) repeat protein